MNNNDAGGGRWLCVIYEYGISSWRDLALHAYTTLHAQSQKKKKELVEICNLIDGPQYQGMALLSAFTICKCTSS